MLGECSSLIRISFEIPSSLNEIGMKSFEGCSSLKEISIPSSVSKIGIYAFKYCLSLKEITIPFNLKGSIDYIGIAKGVRIKII